MRRWTASLLIAVAACDGCRAQPAPKERIEDELRNVEEPTPAEVNAMWERATRGIELAPAAPTLTRYALPSCPLRWQVRWLQLTEIASGREPAGTETLATIAGTAKDGAMEVVLESQRSEALADGTRTPRPDANLHMDPSRLRTDGLRWRETGTGSMWRASGLLPPLAALFPPLPELSEPGARAEWELTLAATRVPAGKEHPIEEMRAQVELPGFLEVGGQTAAVLLGSWPRRRAAEEPLLSRRVEKWRGRFVVLVNGRLLHAALTARTWQWWSPKPGEENEQHGSTEMELRLVEACDGPTLPRF
jgi:hypothetical protein